MFRQARVLEDLVWSPLHANRPQERFTRDISRCQRVDLLAPRDVGRSASKQLFDRFAVATGLESAQAPQLPDCGAWLDQLWGVLSSGRRDCFSCCFSWRAALVLARNDSLKALRLDKVLDLTTYVGLYALEQPE